MVAPSSVTSVGRVTFTIVVSTLTVKTARHMTASTAPGRVRAAALDDLVAVGVLPAERRPGAELTAWSAVHGLSMLLIDGPLRHLDRAQADAAGHQLLAHVEAGLLSGRPPGAHPPGGGTGRGRLPDR